MRVAVILVPYDSGQRNFRMGRGPDAFIQNGLADVLQGDGHVVAIEQIERPDHISSDIDSAFELNRILSDRVRSAIRDKKFPLVLAGNCISSVGTLAGAGCVNSGLIWFDGHGDFNTPQTTVTGFLDGMALAIATGRCWNEHSSTIPEFKPVSERDVILVGARDLDPGEKQLLDGSGIALVSSTFVRNTNIVEALMPALNAIEARIKKVHLHVDLDVLDPRQARANHMAPPGGLFVGETEVAMRMIRGRFHVSSMCIAAYDPAVDPQRNALEAGVKFARIILKDAT